MIDRTVFEEDVAAHQVAAALGFELQRRYRKIEITDEKAVAAAGFTSSKPKPDYGKISAALDAGCEVPGARFVTTEYVLRPKVGASVPLPPRVLFPPAPSACQQPNDTAGGGQ